MDEAEQLANAVKGRTLLAKGRVLGMRMEYPNPTLIVTLEVNPTDCSVKDLIGAVEKAKTVKLYAVEQV